MTESLALHEQQDLALVEAAGGGGAFNADGTVNVVILRPCVGKGTGRRVYTPEVLARDADAFVGLPMFDSHDAPGAKRTRGGLPRSPSELAGVIREAWWEPEFATPGDAEHGFERGAVVGRAAVTDQMESLIRRIPEAVRLSVNAQATGLRRASEPPGAWLVEGIAYDPENSSVDFVTRAGAGGHVRGAALLEAADDDEMTLAEALQTPEVRGYIAGVAAGAVRGGGAPTEDRKHPLLGGPMPPRSATRRYSAKASQILESMLTSPPGEFQLLEVEPDPPADPEPVERVPDCRSGGGRLVEAWVAATPPEQRGWREAMSMRGVDRATIDLLGGRPEAS